MSATTTPNPVLHHVTLKTNRVEEMVRWYATAVGMEDQPPQPVRRVDDQ